MPRKHDVARMTPAEFRHAFDLLAISSDEKLARVLNVDERRVRRWRSGDEDIPHLVRLALETWMTFPGSFDFAYGLHKRLAAPRVDEPTLV